MSEVATLDLSGAVPVSTFTLEIVLPGTSKPTGWKIELAGPAHPATIALANEVSREAIDKANAIEFAQVNGRKWKTEESSLDDRRHRNVGKVCQRILGWSPNPTFKNISPDPIAFSIETATNMFVRPDMGGFFVQVTDYLGSERAFMPPSEQI